MSTTFPSWKSHLVRRLPVLGHRNWIGIVDAAYPLQTASGIEMMTTETDHLTVLKEVVEAVQRSSHVRPRILVDAELDHLGESHVPGIGLLRDELAKVLRGTVVTSLPHEEIIEKLETAARSFNVLLFKTTLTLPYTSVFLELDCGYWSDEAERDLRASPSKIKP